MPVLDGEGVAWWNAPVPSDGVESYTVKLYQGGGTTAVATYSLEKDVLSYNFMPAIRSDASSRGTGTYTYRVTVRAIAKDGGAYISAEESDPSYDKSAVCLPQVGTPAWSKAEVAENRITWGDVSGEVAYAVQLHKAAVSGNPGAAVGTAKSAGEDSGSVDFTVDIGAVPGSGDGFYTVTVQARGDGYYIIDGPVSALSDELDRMPPRIMGAKAVNADYTDVTDASNTSVTTLLVAFDEELAAVNILGAGFVVEDPMTRTAYAASGAALYAGDSSGKTVALTIANAYLARADGLTVSLGDEGAVTDAAGNASHMLPKAGAGPVNVSWWDHKAPGSITGLSTPTIANGGLLDRAVYFTWTDPPDADFDHIEIRYGTNQTKIVAKSDKGTGVNEVTIGNAADGWLTAGTTYSFAFHTVDTAGNRQGDADSSKAEATPIRTSGLSVKVDFDGIPGDATVTANDGVSLSWPNNDDLMISVPATSTVLDWFIDGIAYKDGMAVIDSYDHDGTPGAYSVKLEAQDFTLGLHTVSVRVEEGGQTVSKTVRFRVGK
jgi:hypothetical protein